MPWLFIRYGLIGFNTSRPHHPPVWPPRGRPAHGYDLHRIGNPLPSCATGIAELNWMLAARTRNGVGIKACVSRSLVADVAELADALDSKSGTRKSVGVRSPPSAPTSKRIFSLNLISSGVVRCSSSAFKKRFGQRTPRRWGWSAPLKKRAAARIRTQTNQNRAGNLRPPCPKHAAENCRCIFPNGSRIKKFSNNLSAPVHPSQTPCFRTGRRTVIVAPKFPDPAPGALRPIPMRFCGIGMRLADDILPP